MKLNNHGNTLVEVIVSLVVVSLIMAAMLITYSSFSKTMKEAKALTNMMMEVDSLTDQFTINPGTYSDDIIYYNSTFSEIVSVSEYNGNKIEYTISNDYDSYYYTITIKIYWNSELYNTYQRTVYHA